MRCRHRIQQARGLHLPTPEDWDTILLLGVCCAPQLRLHGSLRGLLTQSQLSGQVAADLTITLTIMYGLITSRTGWSNTDRLLKRLVM